MQKTTGHTMVITSGERIEGTTGQVDRRSSGAFWKLLRQRVAKEFDEGAVGFPKISNRLSSRMGEKSGGSSMKQ